ncbi:hypothetical protein VTN02DRAFT_4106 [Thermoascus thermophilus]
MSAQDGVSGTPSIETAEHPSAALSNNVHHPPHGTHSLGGTTEHSLTSTSKSEPDPAKRSSSVSSISQIPKLSAATTELLARVNGHRARDTIKDDTEGLAKMKASSASIELPTPPFSSSSAWMAPSVPPKAPELLSQQPAKTGLVPIAPKPVETTATPLQPLAAAPPTASQPTATVKRPKPAAASRQRKNGANAKRLKKRRRGHESDDDEIKVGDTSSDESSDVTPVATQTKSGRQIHRPSLFVPDAAPAATPKPKTNSPDRSEGAAVGTTSARKRRRVYRKGKETNVNCVHCQRGHSPSSNAIVFCDECNRAWHQFCHDPPIEKEVIAIKEMEWFCGECRQVAPAAGEVPSDTVRNEQVRSIVEPVQVPPVLPEAQVGGEKFTADEKRAYLSGLSHAALVNLLVFISDRNPTLPMFPSNLRDLQASKFFSNAPIRTPNSSSATAANPVTFCQSSDPSNATVSVTNTANTNHTTNPSATSGPSSDRSTRKKDEEPSDESEYEEVEDHRLYPRAGNGFRLPPDTEDLDMLLEDPACPTFSYALHGPAKSMVESSGLISIGGRA